MTLVLPALAVAFAAFCVWLAVRILNRRERWAKWTFAAVVGVPILYVMSFGPACWLAAVPVPIRFSFSEPPPPPKDWFRIFWPIGWAGAAKHRSPASSWNKAFYWYTELWLARGFGVSIPKTNDGNTWVVIVGK